jgi:sugar phosphate isomerase/epimerase
MKLSTSTLGSFKWDLDETLKRLKAYGFDGIDFRGMQGTLKLWEHPAFAPETVAETAARIQDAGLDVSCISSGICLTMTSPEDVKASEFELRRTVELCKALNCGQLRVFGGRLELLGDTAEHTHGAGIERATERAHQLADLAQQIYPVDMLIETHDAWTHSEHMEELLTRINRPDVACCWDIKHTYWVAREVPSDTLARLNPWLRNTHWKDARYRAPADTGMGDKQLKIIADTGFLCPVGEGVIPLRDAMNLLARAGYTGWYTLEHEKHWHPYIAEPDTAYPSYSRQMRSWQTADL